MNAFAPPLLGAFADEQTISPLWTVAAADSGRCGQ
jgi:hypothetical protein